MTWYYESEIYDPSEEDIKDFVGFVYVVTEKSTNKKYIGKKLFWSTRRLPPLKGNKRKRKVVKESDWRTYCGSNPHIQLIVEEHGLEYYHREILRLCKTKGECSYFEAKMQFDKDVLLSDEYYNGIINCRINAKHLGELRKCTTTNQ
jgi:hypothetical protein